MFRISFSPWVALASLLLIFTCVGCKEVRQRSRASEMIRIIEDYQEQENELPPYLPELENSNIHYRLESDSTYTLWYPIGKGEIEIYHSKTGEWKTEESEIIPD